MRYHPAQWAENSVICCNTDEPEDDEETANAGAKDNVGCDSNLFEVF